MRTGSKTDIKRGDVYVIIRRKIYLSLSLVPATNLPIILEFPESGDRVEAQWQRACPEFPDLLV